MTRTRWSEDSAPTRSIVRANDTDADNLVAPANAGLTVIGKTNGSHGTVAIAADGLRSATRRPPNYNGTDAFTYTISDNGTTNAAGTSTRPP